MGRTRPENNLYVACEEMDFIWPMDDLAEFRDMWRKGCGIEEIREHFGRQSWQEVIIIALDQLRCGYIKSRPDVLTVKGVKA
ncbi:hypothetical protein FQU75_00010 [Paenibacillus polymyxa]|nr:hypothetical protein FQU75_00010 [Paenibacillus polymyxa]